MSDAVALKTDTGRHIGFLLLAPAAIESNTGTEMGDCIVRALPFESDDFAHELAERLYDYQQQGEFEYRRVQDEFGTTIEVAIEQSLSLEIELDSSGRGRLMMSGSSAEAVQIGLAQLTTAR